MQITMESVVEFSKFMGSAGVIIGFVICLVRWFDRQEKQTTDINKLELAHNEDLKNVQEELCVLNYAVLASLDALMQKGFGGNVSEAHTKLQKHINNKAHRHKND